MTWESVPLSEVVKVRRGHDLPARVRKPGSVPVVSSGGVSGYHDVAIVDGPGVVLGRATNLGQPTWVDGPYWPHNTTLYVEDFCGNNPRWVYWWFKTHDLSAFNSGSVQPMLNRNYIAKVPVSLPPLEEQERIAGVLGAFDDLIETNRRLVETLEGLIHGMFAQERFDESPTDDRAVTLRGLISINPRMAKPKGDAPYVDMAMLPTSSALLGTPQTRPAAGGARFQNGDTLVARITPCLENGKTAYVTNLDDQAVAVGSTEFIVLRGEDELSGIWTYALARSPRFRGFAIRQLGDGTSGRQRLSADAVSDYLVPRPSVDALVRFRERSGPLVAAMTALHDEAMDLTRQRDELLPLLMSGKVRVRDMAGATS